MNEREEMTCEICGGNMGTMSAEAYKVNHRHCDSDECVAACTECQTALGEMDGATAAYERGYAYACGYHD